MLDAPIAALAFVRALAGVSYPAEVPAPGMITRRALVPVFLLQLIAGACVDPQKIRSHTALGASVEPIRAQFNKDQGQVRMLMIVAPT